MVLFMEIPPFSLTKQLEELGSDLDEAVLRVLKSGHYIGGEEVRTFEDSFAEFVGVQHVVGCNSGTDALVLALRALGIGRGDEVITCSFSFFATAESISSVGAVPVFIDIDPETYLMDLEEIEKKITSATKAILPVHLFGRPIDMNKLMEIAKSNDLKIIEDCAQATGAEWNGKPVGSWGDIGCFSFFPTKNLGGAGDGGAVATKDEQIAKRIRQLAVHGMPRRYFHEELGYNSRLDAIQAAILNVKLPFLESWIKKRGQIAERYNAQLSGIRGLLLPSDSKSPNMKNSWNQYVVRLPREEEVHGLNYTSEATIKPHVNESNQNYRDTIKQKLSEEKINTIIYYPLPIHLQPAYLRLGFQSGILPITERICGQVLSLPIFPELTFEEQDRVINVLPRLIDRIK